MNPLKRSLLVATVMISLFLVALSGCVNVKVDKNAVNLDSGSDEAKTAPSQLPESED